MSSDKDGLEIKKPDGRASATPQQEQIKICLKIFETIESGLSVRKSCIQQKMNLGTFQSWVESNDLSSQYASACARGIDANFDELQEIPLEEPERDPATGRIDPAWVNLQRLKMDTAKWAISKKAPKKYGDKLEISGDADNPLVIKSAKEMTEEELDALIAAAKGMQENEQI